MFLLPYRVDSVVTNLMDLFKHIDKWNKHEAATRYQFEIFLCS